MLDRTLRRCALAAALALGAPTAALAQDEGDEPIPYPDEEESATDARGLRELPRHSDPSGDFRELSEQEDEEVRYARLDDPNTGVGAELLAGMLLLDSARGQFAEPGFLWGLRFNWEFGRLIADDPFHDALFADVTWAYGALRGGTERIFVDSHYHYFTVAPAWELHVGEGKNLGFFGQLGAGMTYQLTGVHSAEVETTIAGVKPLFQYGVGFRGRHLLSEESNAHLNFRVEVTRFRRGYMDDTLIAGSLGASF